MSILHAVISVRSIYLVLLILIVLLTALFVIVLILTLAILPSDVHGTELAVYYSATIPLDTLLEDRWWLRSMDIAFDADEDEACIGQAAVVRSKNCSTLPTVWEQADTRARDLVCHIYALPGSVLTVLLVNMTNTGTERPHIWVTHSEEAYQKLFKQTKPQGEQLYRCNKTYSDATCYFAEGYIGSTVRFEVEHPGYYCIFLTNGNDTTITPPGSFGIQWHFNYTSYNFTAIKSLYPVVDHWKYINGKTETSVIVSRLFDFTHMNCAVLRLRCTDYKNHRFTIGNLVKRWDVAVLSIILYVVLLSVLVVCMATVHITCKVRNHRRPSSPNELES